MYTIKNIAPIAINSDIAPSNGTSFSSIDPYFDIEIDAASILSFGSSDANEEGQDDYDSYSSLSSLASASDNTHYWRMQILIVMKSSRSMKKCLSHCMIMLILLFVVLTVH